MRCDRSTPTIPRIRERGIVLFVVLIALVVMTIAGIALMRNVDTGQQVAGALAFKQNTLHAGDAGIERGRAWLAANVAGTGLHAHSAGNGYFASRTDPADWDAFFRTSALASNFTDGQGNTVTYVIHRLCVAAGDPSAPASECISDATTGTTPGNSAAAGRISVRTDNRYFYRVTVRVSAPRNTVTYVQSVIAL